MKTSRKSNNQSKDNDTLSSTTITNPILKVLNKIGLYNVDTYDNNSIGTNDIILTEQDYHNLKSKSKIRRVLGMGIDPKSPSILENEVPRANIPDEITDKSMREKISKNIDRIHKLYTEDVLPWPQMFDVRLFIIGLMNESIQWALRSKKEKEQYRKSKDLWMFLHWHFPIVFMWFFYNIIGTYKLETMAEHGITNNDYIMQELTWILFVAGAFAWLLDFVWEPVECVMYDVVIYYAPYSSFSRGFGRETRTNSVFVDTVVSGLFGIIFMILTIMLTEQRPLFGVRDIECWVQFFILWFLPMNAGKSISHLVFYTVLECIAIFLLQYIWIEAHIGFVVTWIIGACIMSIIIGIGGLSYYRKMPIIISEPIYTAFIIGIPCHIIYAICVNFYIYHE